MEDLARCPGIGDRKVENFFLKKNLHNSPHILKLKNHLTEKIYSLVTMYFRAKYPFAAG